MPLRKTRRLPKKFARSASSETRRFVAKRHKRKTRSRKKERLKRSVRRISISLADMHVIAARAGIVLASLLSVLLIGLFLFSPIVSVREIEVARISPRLDIEEVQHALSPLFGKHLFFLSSFEVLSLLNEHIADIEHVKIGKSYPSVLHVAIELHPLVARVHIVYPDDIDDPETATGSIMDFLTDQGIYVQTIAARDSDALSHIRLVDWGVVPKPGDVLITPEMLEHIQATEIVLLRQFGQEVSRRSVYLRAQEFHLEVEGVDLWFDMRNTLEEQLQRYRLFLKAVSLEEVQEYVDLRLSDRVVHK